MSTMTGVHRRACTLSHEDLRALVDLFASVREATWQALWSESEVRDASTIARLDRLERNEGRAWRELAVAQLTESRYGGDPDLAVYTAAWGLGLVPTTVGESAAAECAVLWAWRDQAGLS